MPTSCLVKVFDQLLHTHAQISLIAFRFAILSCIRKRRIIVGLKIWIYRPHPRVVDASAGHSEQHWAAWLCLLYTGRFPFGEVRVGRVSVDNQEDIPEQIIVDPRARLPYMFLRRSPSRFKGLA